VIEIWLRSHHLILIGFSCWVLVLLFYLGLFGAFDDHERNRERAERAYWEWKRQQVKPYRKNNG